MCGKLRPTFSRRYFDGGAAMRRALRQYVADVARVDFPSQAESFSIADDQHAEFLAALQPHQQLPADRGPRDASTGAGGDSPAAAAPTSGSPEAPAAALEGALGGQVILEEILELRRSLKMRLEMLEAVSCESERAAAAQQRQ